MALIAPLPVTVVEAGVDEAEEFPAVVVAKEEIGRCEGPSPDAAVEETGRAEEGAVERGCAVVLVVVVVAVMLPLESA